MVLWTLLTPLFFFLLIIPGYVVVAYVKQRLSKGKQGMRLLNKDRVSAYYTSIRPILRERLQRRSSLNVPKPVKPQPTKHLRSASNAAVFIPPPPPSKSVLYPPVTRGPGRRNSSPVSSVVLPYQDRPDILETYSLHHPQPTSYSSTDEDNSPNSPKTNDSNNNGKNKKTKHLLPQSPNHFYPPSPIILHKKLETLKESSVKIDLPENMDKN